MTEPRNCGSLKVRGKWCDIWDMGMERNAREKRGEVLNSFLLHAKPKPQIITKQRENNGLQMRMPKFKHKVQSNNSHTNIISLQKISSKNFTTPTPQVFYFRCIFNSFLSEVSCADCFRNQHFRFLFSVQRYIV